jgi:hypothetical protein
MKPVLFVLCTVCTLAIAAEFSIAQDKPRDGFRSPYTVNGLPRYTLLNVNNVSAWFRSDGFSGMSPTSQNGIRYPRGTSTTVFTDGFVWGAKAYVDSNHTIPAPYGPIRVGGATYQVGTREGWVVGRGANAYPINSSHPDARIYRIRRAYAHMNSDQLRLDAAEYFEIPLPDVSESHINTIRNQYHTDWTSWPVTLGAPYVERNGISGYQPPPPFGPGFTADSLISGHYDEPGIVGVNVNLPADQVVWTVFNDLDSVSTLALYGTHPLGLEIQLTTWAYNRPGAIGDTYFKRLRLINQGGVYTGSPGRGYLYLDEMYISQWSDPDVGYWLDDLVGCDTMLNLSFAFNGHPRDVEYFRVGLNPPAFGYTLAQGPIVVGLTGDSAIFNFRRIGGRKNLPMTSFGFLTTDGNFGMPLYNLEGGLRWWKWLRGFVPSAPGLDYLYAFPPGMAPNTFPLSGDPVTGSGFVDGAGTPWSSVPSDRRMVLNSGPFRLAAGDTQEVIVVCAGGISSSHRQSVAAMKANAQISTQVVHNLITSLPPIVSDTVTYPNPSEATVRLFTDALGTDLQSMQASLVTRAGAVIASIQLYDDGTHGDTLAGDNIWTNEATVPRQAEGLRVGIYGANASGGSFAWSNLRNDVTTVGRLVLRNLLVFADNADNDGHANPGEIVRYGFSTVNATSFPLSLLQFSPRSEEDCKTRNVSSLASAAIDSMLYHPSSAATYFSIAIPMGSSDTVISIVVDIHDGNDNRWVERLDLPVYQYGFPINRAVLNHVSGSADGEFEILVFDPAAVRNQEYRIAGIDSLDGRWFGFTLTNAATDSVLLFRHEFPDSIAFNVPVTDGFRIRRGTVELRGGMRGWNVPNGSLRFSWVGGQGLFLEGGFNGAIDWDEPCHVFGTCPDRTVTAPKLRNVLVKFATATSSTIVNPNTGFPYGGWNREATTDPNISYAYRYLRGASASPALPEFAPFIVNPSSGYAYQDYMKGIPFSVWDIDVNPPRRLAVGFLENNVTNGSVDGLYWPPPANMTVTNVQASGPREWFFILDADYTGQNPDPTLMVNILSNPVPVMWWGTVTRADGSDFFTGDEFMIYARKVITSSDVWTFNPTTVLNITDGNQPQTFELFQNYPNPFNPSTSIRYQLPTKSRVTIRIYNMLGQLIQALVDDDVSPGIHTVVWNGRNNSGRPIATGVYFYELHAVAKDGSGAFQQTLKMLVLR